MQDVNETEAKEAMENAVDEAAVLLRRMAQRTFELGQAALSAFQAGELEDSTLATLCGEILALEEQLVGKTVVLPVELDEASVDEVAFDESPAPVTEEFAEPFVPDPVLRKVGDQVVEDAPHKSMDKVTDESIAVANQSESVEAVLDERAVEAAPAELDEETVDEIVVADTTAEVQEIADSVQSQLPGCPNCREEVQPGKKFCTNCGFKLDTQEDPAPKVPMLPEEEAQPDPVVPELVIEQLICAHCASPIRSDAKFCTSCGQPVLQANEDVEDTMIDGHASAIPPVPETPVPPISAAPVNPDKFCDNCGRGLPEEAAICPDCGGNKFS